MTGRALARESVAIPGAGGVDLAAVVTRPREGVEREGVEREGAVLFCQTGLQNKAGVGDYFRWLADELARRGYRVVRFDPPGTGDSAGLAVPEPVLPLDQLFCRIQSGLFAPSALDALVWTHRRFGGPIYLFGQCGGAISALLAAAARTDLVAGLILMAAPVLFSADIHALRDYDAMVAGRAYLRKLLRPRTYLRVISGKSDYRRIAATLRAFARRARRRLSRPLRITPANPARLNPRFNTFFWDAFVAMMREEAPVLFLMAQLDNETVELDTNFREPVLDRHAEWAEHCAVEYIKDADHSLLMEDVRLRSREVILGWLSGVARP